MRTIVKALRPRVLTQQNVFQMYLHEYQAYDLLKKYQVPLVPVLLTLLRVLGPTHLKMHWLLRRELWLPPPKINHLLILLSRRRFMLEEEEKECSRNLDWREGYRQPLNLHKFMTMLRRCWEKHWWLLRLGHQEERLTKFS